MAKKKRKIRGTWIDLWNDRSERLCLDTANVVGWAESSKAGRRELDIYLAGGQVISRRGSIEDITELVRELEQRLAARVV